MSLLQTVRDLFEGPGTATRRPTDESKGAYWCHHCDERIRDVDVAGSEPSDCPGCGDTMEFERSVGTSGCAC